MTISETSRRLYESLLATADWSYQQSDDRATIKAGNAHFDQLHGLQPHVDPDGVLWCEAARGHFNPTMPRSVVTKPAEKPALIIPKIPLPVLLKAVEAMTVAYKVTEVTQDMQRELASAAGQLRYYTTLIAGYTNVETTQS